MDVNTLKLKSQQPSLSVSLVSYNIISKRIPSLIYLIILFLFIFFIYAANNDFLISADTISNIVLPGNIIIYNKLTFNSKMYPYMFIWELKLPTMSNSYYPVFSNWNDTLATVNNKPKSAYDYYNEGTLTLYNHRNYILPSKNAANEYVNTYCIGTGLSALPFYFFADVVLGINIEKPSLELFLLSKLVSSFYVSLSVVCVWMIACLYITWLPALFIAISYGLGTIVWSISSQAMYQHGTNTCFLVIGFYYFSRGLLISRYENLIAESTVGDREKSKMEEEYDQKLEDDKLIAIAKAKEEAGLFKIPDRPTFSASRQPERAKKEEADLEALRILREKIKDNNKTFMPSSLTARTAGFSKSLLLSRFINFDWSYDIMLSSLCFCWAIYCRPSSVIFLIVCLFFLVLLAIFSHFRESHGRKRAQVALAAFQILGQSGSFIAKASRKFESDSDIEDDESNNEVKEKKVESKTTTSNNKQQSFETFSDSTKQLLISACPTILALQNEISWRSIRAVAEFLIPILFMGFGLVSYNLIYFGDYWTIGQVLIASRQATEKTGSGDPWSTPLLEGFSYLFISPSRGLLIFSPQLIFSFLSIGILLSYTRPLLLYLTETTSFSAFDSLIFASMEWVEPLQDADFQQVQKEAVDEDSSNKSKKEEAVDILKKKQMELLAVAPFASFLTSPFIGVEKDLSALFPMVFSMALYCTIAALWFDPYGGYTYGPKPLADMMPFFSLLLLPVLQIICSNAGYLVRDKRNPENSIPQSKQNKLLGSISILVLAILLCYSIWVQYIGAFAYNPKDWNAKKCYEVKCDNVVNGKLDHISTYYSDFESAQKAFSTKCEVFETICDIDLSIHRNRLWDWNDNIILYYWYNFDTSRLNKKEILTNWHNELHK